jgi:hypothetical protein
VGGLLKAGKEAAAEQVNITKLNESLKANVKGWNGNTAAIEALISKRELLAFSDDEQRASLALLVGATQDVAKAQGLQALAMDLARFKSIDLETATTAIAKASQGSTRELKALGLEIDDNATAAENLAKIQKTVAGQAAGYAETTAGKFEAVQIKLGDSIEALGTSMIPVFNGIADAILAIIPYVDMAIAQLSKLADAYHVLFPSNTTKTKGGSLKGAIADLARTSVLNGGRASGGPVNAGDVTWVGEQGPELVRFGRASQVYSAPQSAAMTGGGGAPVTLDVKLDGRTIAKIVDEHLYYALRRAGTG